MGIEKKQAEMREMDQNLSAKRMELIELEKTIWRRQTAGPYI
jgi:SUMO ligase MMS21 Smc5/6 complex component